ncbi:hypothetical protein EW093_01175 [Thiospirochaeta perfilievii]|uniref:DNA2/NAM7 helicase-like C-terminal domain-containing protein n=1 Tax=Thiospirochaeta perfilievii TaxID=252967 RepID=A0A5C1QB36_9SPIO|nr:AAA domain-containing protein [Thiospirochaeta perfilievii]QEN03372.1 hypothetical protein EW093_01175 [Thiospirochaeta perfilievii]
MFKKQSSILGYWKAIEYFSPQSIPFVNNHSKEDPVFLFEDDYSCIWNNPSGQHYPKLEYKQSRQYHLYIGVYKQNIIENILSEKFGHDENIFNERELSESCLFFITLDAMGIPIEDSIILSSSSWAINNTLENDINSRNWLKGFDESFQDIKQFFNDYINQFGRNDRNSLEPNYRNLKIMFNTIIDRLGYEKLINNLEIRIKPVSIYESKDSNTESDFLNSFYLDELEKLSSFTTNSDLGVPLSKYLTINNDTNVNKRVDCRKDLKFVYNMLAPNKYPKGRWPSKGHFPLVLSQQFALNSLFNSNVDLFSVNGPPGTGKTTLLRDLMANIVVERAIKIASLDDPFNGFIEDSSLEWESGSYKRKIKKLQEEICGYEMVIASNNNGAVENVTLEIPGINAIDESWLEYINYFKEISNEVMSNESWGLFAGRLGNKSNRSKFASDFYFGRHDSNVKHFLEELKYFETDPVLCKEEWTKSLLKFKKLHSLENRLRNKRQEVFNAIINIDKIREVILRNEAIYSKNFENKEIWKKEKEKLQQEIRSINDNIEINNDYRLRHKEFKPSLLEIIFTFGRKFKIWNIKDLEFIELDKELVLKLSELRKLQNDIDRNYEHYNLIFIESKKELDSNRDNLKNLEKIILDSKEKWGEHTIPDINRWKKNLDYTEKSSPWADDEWNKVRAELFIASLKLHKAFIMINARSVKTNLNALFNDVLTGSLPKEVKEVSVLNCWRTLFLIVPVLSSSFASYSRLFSRLKKESLGWLLIDEAGQSAPQNAAGAIWRSQHSVIVGDPFQLEPIVNIPFSWQNAIKKRFNVPDIFMPSRSSVQLLADRVNNWGTYIDTDESKIWIGSPLKVHRRCNNPMFNICNTIAYDGMMVSGKNNIQSNNIITPSQWIDVQSKDAQGHWIKEEGKQTEHLIQYLLEKDIASNQIFLISPFRDVVRNLKKIAKKFNGINAGTIHTVQGKEADVVILVLGGNPEKPGAKSWASSKPNLLNVAASRAKERLFIIGNMHLWGKYRYFDTCIKYLLENVRSHVN